MLQIDPKMQPISSASRVGKQQNKEKTKFVTGKKTREISHNEGTSAVANISDMLFLQEIDQFEQDTKNLEEFAKKAFKVLNDLQLDLLQGRISADRVVKLREVLKNSQFIISTPQLAEIANQINIRLEVEMAKIEVATSGH
ncbi:MAG: hypothetical protein J0L79_04250 [Rickettsiales bacterium]|nr:hypothetical protein [Rickettsiales bacterium]MCA0254513.1 hypothetical protein [Pseudomonadota bacterium]